MTGAPVIASTADGVGRGHDRAAGADALDFTILDSGAYASWHSRSCSAG
jgi:hypothetical protein